MGKRKAIDELEYAVVNNAPKSDKDFLELADILIVDYLVFNQTEDFWTFNFIKNGKESNIRANTTEEVKLTMDILVMEALNQKIPPPTDITYRRRYNLGIDEILISLYYTRPLQMHTGKPETATISSTTTFELDKEIIPHNKIRQEYEVAAKKTR